MNQCVTFLFLTQSETLHSTSLQIISLGLQELMLHQLNELSQLSQAMTGNSPLSLAFTETWLSPGATLLWTFLVVAILTPDYRGRHFISA